ncbi:uncharacterized protein LOC128232086 [Mya arenaria]|uniref:uncharacterized protein LOC128232086 n=1 Tax=Mya arenaria TaxID=6604 RepID=UPI0022DEC0E6|nr:uncharacterized protein LOC128232086 [Mya arenaria]XP_052801397.1 uncharacterized protein LOC128232086 [Mya arenaria]XP_052801398.1 uncharacterized protein LOC128232086 [Mya arenaria]
MRLTCVQFRGVMLLVYTVYLTPTSADLGSQDIDPLMLESHSSLSPLRNTLSSLNDYLVEYQKRSCQFGLNSHHCALSALDDMKGASEWLSSAHSPGKRSQEPTDTQDKFNWLLDDVVNKRAHLATLQALLDTAEEQMNAKRKRTCRFNLGGRCATELASAIADQYYYLNGPSSPGRRRRRSASGRHIQPINNN